MTSKKASFAFFLGSGISYASYQRFGNGTGTVSNITNRLFNGRWKYSAERFYPADPKDDPIFLEEAKLCQEFLRILKKEIDPHLTLRGCDQSNYEDLFAAAYYIWNDELEEIVSPLIARSSKALRDASKPIWSKIPPDGSGDSFRALVRQSQALIQSVVWAELARDVKPLQLKLISDMATRVSRMDVFTLNHDGLVERQLESAKIPYTDGFEDLRDGYKMFSPAWDKARNKILKLHGSLNWKYCEFERSDGGKFEQTAIFDRSVDKCRFEGRPIRIRRELEFLTGTTVKENSYGHDIIGDLFIQFRRFSSDHRTIVFCGYGWGDKGINIRVDQWLRDQRQNKIIILHKGDPNLVREKRFWLSRWKNCYAKGKVRVLPFWLGDCDPGLLHSELVF